MFVAFILGSHTYHDDHTPTEEYLGCSFYLHLWIEQISHTNVKNHNIDILH